jgi:hypothetical protein
MELVGYSCDFCGYENIVNNLITKFVGINNRLMKESWKFL